MEPEPTRQAGLSVDHVCFITDEYSANIDEAIAFASSYGVAQAEIRAIDDRYGFLHEPAKLREVRRKLDDAGIRVALLATPVMKCVHPKLSPTAAAENEIKLSEAAFPIPRDEQFPRTEEFLKKAIEAADILGTELIRVFSFWRTAEPDKARPYILEELRKLSTLALDGGKKLCIENEGACNLADCHETMTVISQAPGNVGMIWDVVNGLSTGETPYPNGYRLLDKSRIWHMHLKDAQVDAETGKQKTVAVGDGIIPYPEIFQALAADGYAGAVSMETHFSLDGSRKAASEKSMEGILRAIESDGSSAGHDHHG